MRYKICWCSIRRGKNSQVVIENINKKAVSYPENNEYGDHQPLLGNWRGDIQAAGNTGVTVILKNAHLLNQTNFDLTLPEERRAQAKLAVKDEYTFDFAKLSLEYSEHELEMQLANNIRAFLIEMGGDFTLEKEVAFFVIRI